MVWTALFSMVILSAFLQTTLKGYKTETESIKNSSNIFVLITCITAMSFFAIMSGGKLTPNIPTLIYSACLAFVAFASVLAELFAITRTSLVNLTVFASAGSILIPFLFGLIFLGEGISATKVIAAVMLLAVILLPLFSGQSGKKTSFSGYISCIILFIMNGMYTVLMDIYAGASGVLPDSVFCFWGNAIMFPFAFLLGISMGGTKNFFSDIKKIKAGSYAKAVITVVFSNTTTLLGIYILGRMDISIYSILNTSLVMIFTAIFSAIFFKEKITTSSVLAIVLSIGAIILNTI